MKELFRLADPDHSKSIDLAEFRVFLFDLQSLETEPERFQREMVSRLERSVRTMKARSVGKDEFGLFSAAFHPLGAGGFEGSRRPVSTSYLVEGNGDGVDRVNVPIVSLASRRSPDFTVVHPSPEDVENYGGARAVEEKTEEV